MEKQPTLSVWCGISPYETLIDMRVKTHGDVLGTVGSVARQYGIKVEEKDNGLLFTAPKSRLQMFVEKLHFSGKAFRPI